MILELIFTTAFVIKDANKILESKSGKEKLYGTDGVVLSWEPCIYPKCSSEAIELLKTSSLN